MPKKQPFISPLNLKQRKLFLEKAKNFGFKRIMNDVAFSDEKQD